MKRIIYLTFILLGGCSGNSKKETYTACTTTGVVDKVVWGYSRQDIKKLAYLTFIHDEQPYTFREDFSPLMKINVGDSVLVQYRSNNPKKASKFPYSVGMVIMRN